jgi:ribosomal protein L37AE/L43A
MNGLSGYPPGVTGREYEIAGPDYEKETDERCPECGSSMTELGYSSEYWLACDHCDYSSAPESRFEVDE